MSSRTENRIQHTIHNRKLFYLFISMKIKVLGSLTILLVVINYINCQFTLNDTVRCRDFHSQNEIDIEEVSCIVFNFI